MTGSLLAGGGPVLGDRYERGGRKVSRKERGIVGSGKWIVTMDRRGKGRARGGGYTSVCGYLVFACRDHNMV
jgi:hypothetical protein